MANAIDIVINATDKASGKIDKVNKSFEGLKTKAEKASKAIATLMGIGSTALGAIAVAGAKQNAMLETSQARWTTLLKSQDKAIEQMKWLQDFAKSSPFDYQGLDEASTSMLGMGISLENVRKWLPVLGDVAGTLGGGTETIKGISIALGQMSSKGKVSAEEMMQLAERGVSAWQFLADGMGLSVAEVQKLSSEGKLLAKDALPLIIQGMEKTFGGGMQNYMKSTIGQVEQAKENFSQFAGVLTSPVYQWFGSQVMPLVNSALEKLTDIFSGGLLEGFQKLWDSSILAKGALIALAGTIVGTLIGAFALIAPHVWTAITAFAPFLAIGLAVAGLALIIWRYWEPIKAWFVNTFGEIASAFANFFTGIWNLIQPILSEVVGFIGEKLSQMKQFWNENGASILQAVQNVWSFISGFISVTLNVILAIFQFIFPVIQFIVLSVWEGIKGIINGALNFIMGIIQVFSGLFTGNWSLLWEGIKNMVSGAIQFLWNLFTTFFAGKIIGVIGKFAGNALKYFSNLATKAGTAISGFVSKAIGFFTNLATKVINSVKNWVTNVFKAVDDFVYKVLGKIAGFNADLGLLFAKGWEAVKGFVKSGINGAINVIKGMFSTFKKSGEALLDAFKDGIKKGINKAVNAVKEGVKKIRDFLPFSPAKRGALSDLDVSGKSFFPTFAKGVEKGLPAVLKTVGQGMTELDSVLAQPVATMEQLDSFNFGRVRQTVDINIEVTGGVDVNGQRVDSSATRETMTVVNGSVEDILNGLRQAIRKR